jgi:uncharacterized delta-60 repeat protein/gliding motility-associated-like protein
MKSILLAFFFLLCISVRGQDGTRDNSFGTNGVAQTALVSTGASTNSPGDLTKIITQPDGKILQVGYKSSSTGDDFIVIRYLKDGSLDMPFGVEGGWRATNINGDDRAHSVALQSDGKIIVVGESFFNGKNIGALIRYTTTGALDPSFGTNGILRSDLFTGASGINSVAIQPDGKIVVAGFAYNGSNNDFFIARYLSNGTLDAGFGTGGKTVSDLQNGDIATDVKILADGRILLAGTANTGVTSNRFALALYSANGQLDASFNGTGKLVSAVSGQGRSVAVTNDGRIYLTGLSGGAFTIVSYLLTGALNSTFGGTGLVQSNLGGVSNSRSVMVQCDGKVVVGGDIGGTNYAVARYLATGAPDVSFNGNGRISTNTGNGNRDNGFSGLAFQDGKILMGGISFVAASFFPKFHPTVIRLNNASVIPNLQITHPAPVCSPAVVDLTAPAITAGSETGLTYTYWQDTLATIVLSNPASLNTPGRYFIKATTAAGCFVVKGVAVTILTPPGGSVSPTSAGICPGASQLLTATGGTAYQWQKDGVAISGATSATYSATSAGTYSVILSNGSCTAAASYTSNITLLPAPAGTITPTSSAICSGSSQVLTANGGTSYQWFQNGSPISGATGATYNATTAGTYSATIFNNGCSAPASNTAMVTVNNGVTPTISISSSPSGSLTPGTAVTFTATITNGGAAPVYQWKINGNNAGTGGPTFTTSSLVNGDVVTAVLTSNAACTNPVSVTSNSITIAMASVTPSVTITANPQGPICSGTSVTFTATSVNGGSAPTYQWKINGNPAGTNTATFTSAGFANGDVVTVEMTSNAPGATPAVVTSNSITLDVTAAVSPSVAITASPGTTFCAGTTLTFTATPQNGGTAPFYQWRKNGVQVGTNAASFSTNALATGDVITVAMTSNATCASPVSVTSNPLTLNSTPLPTGSITPATATICNGTSQVLTATGGTGYQWSRNGTVIGGATGATYAATAAGTYSVVLTSNGCSAPAFNTATVTVNASPSGAILPAAASFCAGGSQLLTTSGGTAYQWQKDGTPISGATGASYMATESGTYSVVIYNGACPAPASNTASITVTPAPAGTVSPANAPICPGGTQTLTATGGTAYQWKKDGVAITGATGATYTAITAGTYTVTVYQGTCAAAASNASVITVSASPSGSITPATAGICPGGSQVLTVTGGTSYQWSRDGVPIPGATGATYNAMQTGTYSAIINNGTCSGPAANTSIITVSTSPSGPITPASATICPGGAQVLTATGGDSYQWVRDGVAISGATRATYTATAGGNYSVMLSANGCTGPASNTAVITVATAPSGAITPATASICEGGSQLLTASGGSSYQWQKDGVAINGATGATYGATTAGTYSVLITTNNCTAPASNIATVTVNPLPAGTISPASSTICPGGMQTLTATGGTSYQWSRDGIAIPGATDATYTVSVAGNYTVLVRNGACSAMASNTAVVTVGAAPSGTISPASAAICTGGSQLLTATGGTSYQWSRNGVPIPSATGATYTATETGTYSVLIINGACNGPASNTVTVTTTAAPSGTVTPATASICTGGSQILTATGGTSYQWSRDGVAITGATGATYTATGGGTYTTMIFTGSCSGAASNQAIITVAASPSGAISPSAATLCAGKSQVLTATGADMYQWQKDGAAIAGATGASYSATTAGTYTVLLTKNNCTAPASNAAVITVTPLPSGSVTPASSSICTGGSQVLSTSGGTSYQWMLDGSVIPGAVSSSYTATAPGTYTVMIINGPCSAPAANSATITLSAAPSGSVSPAAATLCTGGSQVLTATGGTAYQWTLNGTPITGATSATYTATTTGTYGVLLTNGSCAGPASNTAVISMGAAPTGSITPATATVCAGASQTFTATGGTSYQWRLNGTPISGATGPTYTATMAGTYSVILSNGSCSVPASNEAILAVTPLPSGAISPLTVTICNGGSQVLTASGGSSYQWMFDGAPVNGATSATYTATQAGRYTASITQNGCMAPAPDTATVTVSSAPSGTITPAAATICTGGAQTFTATGGTSYQWSRDGMTITGATAASYTASLAGTYSVIIYNGTCSGPAVNTAVLTVGMAPTGAITPAAVSICEGSSQVLTATGGTSYQWFLNGALIAGATGANLTATVGGTYSVTLFSGTCNVPATNTATVTVKPKLSGTISPAAATICPGSSQVLTFTGSGSMQWYLEGTAISGATGTNYSATTAGTYTVMLIENGCSAPASNSAVITTSTAPSGSITPASAAICSGGSQLLTATGGTAYQWYVDGSAIPGAVSATYTAMQPGTYSVVISNGGCTGPASNTATVTLSTAPSGAITPAAASLCTGGTQLLTASGGDAYQWSLNGTPIGGATSATYTASQAGTYSVMVFNGSCSGPASNPAIIMIGTSPTGSITPVSATICENERQLLTATGGSSYQWMRDGVVITGATAATYTATERGTYSVLIYSGTCSGPASNTSTITITTAVSPLVSITASPAGVINAGTPVTFTATPTYGGPSPVFQWMKNGIAVGATAATYTDNNLQNGDVVYVIMNGNAACATAPTATSNRLTVSVNAGVTASVTIAANPGGSVCAGIPVTFTATPVNGGSAPSYAWKKNGMPVGTDAATYTTNGLLNNDVIVVEMRSNAANANPSVATSNTLTVTVNQVVGSVTPTQATICPGGSQTLTATGGTAYQWRRNGSPINGAIDARFTATLPGTYTVLLTNNGCSAPAGNSALISTGNVSTGTITPASATICAGSTQVLRVSGGSSYQWSRNGVPIAGATGAAITVSQEGSYTAQIFSNGCAGTASNTVAVTIARLPSGTITPGEAVICSGSSQLLKATGGTSYEWFYNGVAVPDAYSDTLRATQEGTYRVIVVGNGCSAPAANEAVIRLNRPAGTITPAAAGICPGGSKVLSITGGESYQWMLNGVALPGATGNTYAATQAGTYTAMVRSAGCTGMSANAAVITQLSVPVASLSPSLDSICLDETKLLTAAGGSSYQWHYNGSIIGGATTATYMATKPGSYTVTASNGSCFSAVSNTALIKMRVQPKNQRYLTLNVASGQPYPMQARPGLSYDWSPAAGLSDTRSATPVVTVTTDQDYIVRITQANSCPFVDTVTVRVFDRLEIYVPTGFTPNGDGKNDVLRPIAVHIKEIRSFKVLNRWGEVIFQTNKIGEGWNGTYKGIMQPNDAYVWYFEGKDINGKNISAKGTSVLIR